jgi:Trypsin-co-occurring domain 1
VGELIRVPLDDGGFVVVESSEALMGPVAAARPGEIVADAAETLESGLTRLQPALTRLLDKLRAVGPNDVTVEFGIKLSSKAGIVIAEASGETNFKATLSWREAKPTST